MVRQARLIAAAGTFLIGCAVLLVVGCSGVRSEAPREGQGHTGAANEEQVRSRKAASEADPCGETRYINRLGARYTTNDVPGCPKGGLLSGTDEHDLLAAKDGEDEVRGLGSWDELSAGADNDVIYGGAGDDFVDGGHDDDVLYGDDGSDSLFGVKGKDILYGGDGNHYLDGRDEGPKDTQRDELFCGAGKDKAIAGKLDSVSSSCEVQEDPPKGGRQVRVD